MKPFAIYFPQFYPTATNDAAWGQGFTDWSLVANANLRDQWQRRAPRRGFYDGASADVHCSQIVEMKQAGLGGFALYHYWFYSHQELAAFESTLLARSPGFPWFMIWATEGWSKRWLGDSTPLVHLSQAPSNDEIDAHCAHLAKCFSNPDYLRIEGKPLFVIYNLSHFDQPADVVSRYRETLALLGHEIFVGHFIKNPFEIKYSKFVDASYLFEPRLFFGLQRAGRGGVAKKVHDALRVVLGESVVSRLLVLMDRAQQRGTTYSASQFLSYLGSPARESVLHSVEGHVQEVISPGWNNTPRYSERFTCLESLEASTFGRLVSEAEQRCGVLPPLVNAWNEWSEGAAIEPCAYLGTQYLDALKPKN